MRIFNLTEELEKERKKNKELEERIDKAIEYIEIVKGFNEEYKDDWEFKVFIPHLLNILKGDNK